MGAGGGTRPAGGAATTGGPDGALGGATVTGGPSGARASPAVTEGDWGRSSRINRTMRNRPSNPPTIHGQGLAPRGRVVRPHSGQ
ncbi:MAG: hypothetical protein KY468_07085 [Armatimonadetes bacterium]|nr:hypothetical protein [Armatimonadota bacterium]